MENNFDVMMVDCGVLVKMWMCGVLVEDGVKEQLVKIVFMLFIFKYFVVMLDVYQGFGLIIGSVILIKLVIIFVVVGVDIGCGMMVVCILMSLYDLLDNLVGVCMVIEVVVLYGWIVGMCGCKGWDKGVWGEVLEVFICVWVGFVDCFDKIIDKYGKLKNMNNLKYLGILGMGNYFIEVCLDEVDQVWFMFYLGLCGVGNVIGCYFIECVKLDMEWWFIYLLDNDFVYFLEGMDYFNDYVEVVEWVQEFVYWNCQVMMENVIVAVCKELGFDFEVELEVVNCYYNYVICENYFGENIFVMCKGVVWVVKGVMGIIFGLMGVCFYIV